MPLVTVKAIAGRTLEQKRALVKDITDAVVRDFDTPPESVIVDIVEMSREDFGKAGKLLADS